MSITSVVKKYADFLIQNIKSTTNDDELNEFLCRIGSMENYDDLSQWEQHVQETKLTNEFSLEEDAKYNLAIELFEFGRFNLYTQFDCIGIQKEHEKLVEMFKKQGFLNYPPVQVSELDRW